MIQVAFERKEHSDLQAIVAKIAAQANAKIQTERLYLRELTPADDAELKTFLQDEEVMYA